MAILITSKKPKRMIIINNDFIHSHVQQPITYQHITYNI
jgi:hypothetical protein